ncbi:MAG TPA: SPOR domain-containing protein [Bacteroidota bacterium]|nr:SPOR domain-containing protein [Bacteroidota bacterium]
MNVLKTSFQFALLALVLSFALTAPVFAQLSEPEVRKRLDFIYNGQAERVRIELPTLQKQYPNDPGVAYLDAILTTDGVTAVKKFQTIVDQFPQNEWADDALYKVYQYYYSVGLYKTADEKFQQLKEQYPNSLYVVGLAEEQKASVVHQEPAPEPKKPDTTSAAPAVEPSPAEVTVQPPTDTAAVVAAPAPPVGKFAVQAGAFSTDQNARKQVDFFATIGKKAMISTKVSGGRTLYVVSLEGFTTEQEARNTIAELKSKYNIESIIVAR